MNLLTSRVSAIPKLVFLPVGLSENVQTDRFDEYDRRASNQSEIDRVEGEVSRLQAIHEWHPDEVTKGKHESEAVGRDVHLVQNGRLCVV